MQGKTILFHHFKGQSQETPFLMRDVGVATAAAPTYLPSHAVSEFNLIDGGLAANNPALLAFMKASAHIQSGQDVFILSLGTGEAKLTAIHAIDSQNYGMVQWLPMILDVIFKSAQEMLTLQFKLLKYARGSPLTLLRIQPLLETPSQEMLDNTSPENIASLKHLASKYFDSNQDYLQQELIQPLKKHVRKVSS